MPVLPFGLKQALLFACCIVNVFYIAVFVHGDVIIITFFFQQFLLPYLKALSSVFNFLYENCMEDR